MTTLLQHVSVNCVTFCFEYFELLALTAYIDLQLVKLVRVFY